MAETKIQSCPMSFNSPKVGSTIDCSCIKNRCAWWVTYGGDFGKCAILQIAENINQEKK